MIAERQEMSAKVNVLVGDEVFDLLSDDTFLNSWDELYRSCPWATPFQSRAFVTSWYRIYDEKYIPIMVTAWQNSSLSGLLTLGKQANSKTIDGAGALNAEYHAWLAPANDNDRFIKAALEALQSDFPDCVIELRYIPAQTPLSWLKSDKRWQFKRVVRGIDQPFIALNEAHFEEKLNTKAKRKIIHRLEQHGELSFERITDVNVFASVFDELIAQSDFRKAAMYNKTPFRDDPLKKELNLALFNQNLLHVTVLKLNEKIIASKIITIDRDWGYLKGLLTHSPHFARQSPGLLHFLMLGQLLTAEGKSVFDLTPGGDPYKDQLATNHAEVYHVWFVNSTRTYLQKAVSERIKKIGREILISRRIDPKRFKTQVIRIREKLKQKGFWEWIKQLVTSKSTEKHLASYVIKPDATGRISRQINKDNLKDLLDFEAGRPLFNRWKFLADAMKRMEAGEHVYTITANGRLAACAWQGGKSKSDDGTIILQGLYCNPGYRDSFTAFLKAVAEKASDGNSATGVLTVVDADDRDLNRILASAA